MKEIEKWMNDCKCIYFSFDRVSDNINEFKLITINDIPKHNSIGFTPGFYGYIEDEISYCWIDLINCKTIRNDYDDSIIPKIFEYNRNEWISKKRKEKLLKICHQR